MEESLAVPVGRIGHLIGKASRELTWEALAEALSGSERVWNPDKALKGKQRFDPLR